LQKLTINHQPPAAAASLCTWQSLACSSITAAACLLSNLTNGFAIVAGRNASFMIIPLWYDSFIGWNVRCGAACVLEEAFGSERESLMIKLINEGFAG